MGSIDFTDKGFISKYGGGVLIVRKVLDTGLPLTMNISDITKANPAVVTVDDVGDLANGDVIIIEAVGGMTEVNDLLFTVASLGVAGANKFELSGVDSSGYGAYTTGGTAKLANITNLGYLQETAYKYDKPIESINDETGNTVKTVLGDAVVTLNGILMQTGTTLLDFLRDTVENQFYHLYYKCTPTDDLNGITQEYFAALARVRPMFEVKSGVRRVPFEITLLKNDAAVTIGEPDVIFGSIATADVVIALGKYYELVEN